MLAEFAVTVNYAQIIVYRRGLARPGLLWDDDHVAQGFAWDHEIVAFGVPDHDGECLVQVDLTTMPDAVSVQSLWMIETPFEVTTGQVEIGTILDTKLVTMPIGNYSLYFKAFPGAKIDGSQDYPYRVRLAFCPNSSPAFGILKSGELGAQRVLRRDARRV